MRRHFSGVGAAPAVRPRKPELGRPRDPIGGHYDPSARCSLDRAALEVPGK